MMWMITFEHSRHQKICMTEVFGPRFYAPGFTCSLRFAMCLVCFLPWQHSWSQDLIHVLQHLVRLHVSSFPFYQNESTLNETFMLHFQLVLRTDISICMHICIFCWFISFWTTSILKEKEILLRKGFRRSELHFWLFQKHMWILRLHTSTTSTQIFRVNLEAVPNQSESNEPPHLYLNLQPITKPFILCCCFFEQSSSGNLSACSLFLCLVLITGSSLAAIRLGWPWRLRLGWVSGTTTASRVAKESDVQQADPSASCTYELS